MIIEYMCIYSLHVYVCVSVRLPLMFSRVKYESHASPIVAHVLYFSPCKGRCGFSLACNFIQGSRVYEQQHAGKTRDTQDVCGFL